MIESGDSLVSPNRLFFCTFIQDMGLERNVKADGFYFRSLEVVHLCPATKRLHFRDRSGAVATLMMPGRRGDPGRTFLSFIHYAVCVTQRDVVSDSFSDAPDLGTVILRHIEIASCLLRCCAL